MNSSDLTIRVRDAVAGDAAVIADYNARMAMEVEHCRLDPAVALRGAQVGLQRHDLARYWVAEVDGRVVGQAMVTYEWSDWRAGLFWWFQSVYVLPEYRRHGVFTALYRHAEAAAKADPQVCGLRLYVEENNHRAHATYRRLGMKPSGHLLFEIDWSDTIRDAGA